MSASKCERIMKYSQLIDNKEKSARGEETAKKTREAKRKQSCCEY